MNDEDRLTLIKQKVAALTGIDPRDISNSTRLYHDAKISGDEYYEFMVWFSREFRVNLKGFNVARFAPPESTNFFWPFERKAYNALSVADLLELSHHASWAESGLAQRLPTI